MQPVSMLSRVIHALFVIGLIAIIIVIASGILQIMLFFAAIGVAIWLLRKIPFIRQYTDQLLQSFIEKHAGENIYPADYTDETEKDITLDAKIIESGEKISEDKGKNS